MDQHWQDTVHMIPVGQGELNVSGSATVIDNTAGGKNNNVFMTSSTQDSGYETLYVKLDISDPFSGIIGVSTKDKPVAGKPVVAAASATPGVDYSKHIVSDDTQYKIRHVGYMLMLTTADEPNHQHTWDEGKITKQPTTSEEGVKTYTCTACGATKTESIEKLVSNIYKIIDGANGKHTIGKDGTLTFRSNAPFSEFGSVLVDGVIVDRSNYDVSEGSTIVRLKQSFLDTPFKEVTRLLFNHVAEQQRQTFQLQHLLIVEILALPQHQPFHPDRRHYKCPAKRWNADSTENNSKCQSTGNRRKLHRYLVWYLPSLLLVDLHF